VSLAVAAHDLMLATSCLLRFSTPELSQSPCLPDRWVGESYMDLLPDVVMDELGCLSWCGESWKLVSHLPLMPCWARRCWLQGALSASVLVVPPLLLQAIGCARWRELHVLDLAAIAESKFEGKYDNISKNRYTFLSSISASCFLPGGQHLVCGTQDGTILLLDHQTGLQLHSVRVHKRRITSFSCSQQAGLLAVGDECGFVSVWDLADGCFTMVQLCR
jgi:hypothetical protein